MEENMRKDIRGLIAIGLVLASTALPVTAKDVHGLDFGQYLLLEQGMTEGEVLSIAGPPDLHADQGFAHASLASGHAELAIRTFTYLPTNADPETTTITFVGGLVRDIRRDKMY